MSKLANYDPKNLEEALHFLIKDLTPDIIEFIKRNDPAIFHLSVGMNIRNEWDLWTNSKLYKWFVDELKITHPDDMSGIILTSLKRRLMNEDIRLNEQVETYLEYWKENQ